MSAPITAHTFTAVLQPLGIPIKVRSASLTLDESRAPYAQLNLEAAMPEPAQRALIDIRETPLYVEIGMRQDFGAAWALADLTADIAGSVSALTALLATQPLGQLTNRYYVPWNSAGTLASRSRLARLTVDERAFDDTSAILSISAASGEVRLISDALLAIEPWNPGTTSLRDICALVLARYGAFLAPGLDDAIVVEATSTIWQPGTGAWEYLNPMLEAASLRLWCNEEGIWRLTQRQTTTAGAVKITPERELTRLTDRMTFDPAVWYDAVVVEYRWVDDTGVSQVKYDIAGSSPPRAVRRVERSNTRYPGPGAAAGLLSRAKGRGRVLEVEALSDYTLSPGMPATINPPATPAQTGFVASVTWRFPDDEMNVTTRGLVDTPATSWLFLLPGESWIDSPPGESWIDETI